MSADTVGGEPLTWAFRSAFWMLDVLFKTYFRGHVSGREHLPPPGTPTVVTPNHASAIDPLACGYAVRRPAHYVAKAEATQMPLVGRYMLATGAVPARRDHQDTEVLRQAMTILRAGGIMGVAPEGTRSPDGRLGAYDPGFVWLALRTGAVVTPLAIHGAERLMPKGARLPRPGDVWIRFGEPVSFADEGRRVSRERMQALADDVRARTVVLLGELAAESGLPNPSFDEESR